VYTWVTSDTASLGPAHCYGEARRDPSDALLFRIQSRISARCDLDRTLRVAASPGDVQEHTIASIIGIHRKTLHVLILSLSACLSHTQAGHASATRRLESATCLASPEVLCTLSFGASITHAQILGQYQGHANASIEPPRPICIFLIVGGLYLAQARAD